MPANVTPEARTKRINTLVSILTREQPDILEKELKRLYLNSKIKKIRGSVIKNSLTMDDIVEETNIVRKERYAEKQNCV